MAVSPEVTERTKLLLGLILFGRRPSQVSLPEQLAALAPMSRRRPAMTAEPDFDAGGDILRSSISSDGEVLNARAEALVSEINAGLGSPLPNDKTVAPVSLRTSLAELTSHWVAHSDDETPIEEGDSFVDMCAFEHFEVSGGGTDLEVTLFWCTEYPGKELGIAVGPGRVVRPLAHSAQPMACAVDCIERLTQALGEEIVRESGLTYDIEFETFGRIREKKG